MSASIDDVKMQVDKCARSNGFRCVPVSWEDATRGTVSGSLSCWGANISDVRLWERSGKILYTLRSNNWNERLGYVSAKDIAIVVGNHASGASHLSSITLQKYLANVGEYARYAGLGTHSLHRPEKDHLFSIRFQTVFLPVEGSKSIGTSQRVEFCTEVYNYNTHSDENPRNALLLCTAQGTSFQQDGRGAKKIFHHEVDGDGNVHRYWLEAERSSHAVGGAQNETEEEALTAASRGKSTAVHIGTRAMGTRFNVQMLIQLPVEMQPLRQCKAAVLDSDSDGETYFMCFSEKKTKKKSCAATRHARERAPSLPSVGISNAARVSRGSEEDAGYQLTKRQMIRDAEQHGTITVTMYYTVVGGVPSEADVLAAIEDLNSLYESCAAEKKLVNADEITKELTVTDMQNIHTKVVVQPYQPEPLLPMKNNGFPVD